MDEWLSAARNVVARTAGVAPVELDLDEEAIDTLLELARIAAHESGERTNAPLLCYLVGVATHGGRSLAELAEALRREPL